MSERKLQEKWIELLEQWHLSGMSGNAWCQSKNISYHVFLYWKKKLEQKKGVKPNCAIVSSSSFVEILESSKGSSGFEIEYREAIFRLSKDFDGEMFQRCIHLLRGI